MCLSTDHRHSCSKFHLHVYLTRVQVLSVDALSLRGGSHLSAMDLQVRVLLPFSRCHASLLLLHQLCHVEGESLFFVVAPADIVVAKARDCDDHVTWLMQRQRVEEAMKYAEEHASSLQAHSLHSIAEKYNN